MRSLLYWLVLRPLLETPLRLVACFLVGAALVMIPDLLLKRFVDADLPRTATAALGVTLAGACLFLRASWQRRGPAGRRRDRAFAPRFANARPFGGPTGEAVTRTVVVLDRDASDAYSRSTVHARARRLPSGPADRPGWFGGSIKPGQFRGLSWLKSIVSALCQAGRRLLARLRRQ